MSGMIRTAMKYRRIAKESAGIATVAACVALLAGVGGIMLHGIGRGGLAALALFVALLGIAAAFSWARECARCSRIADQLEAEIGRRHNHSTLD